MKSKDGFDITKEYDKAPVAAGGSSLQDDYNSADPAAADSAKPPGDDEGSELSIPPDAVAQMRQLKDSGDMAGLGQMVSQYL